MFGVRDLTGGVLRLGLPPDSKKPLPPAGNQSRNRSHPAKTYLYW